MIKNYAQTLYSTKCKGFKTNGLAFRNGHEIEENMVKQTAMIKILRTMKMIAAELRRVNLQSTNTENTDNYKLAEKQDQNTMVVPGGSRCDARDMKTVPPQILNKPYAFSSRI